MNNAALSNQEVSINFKDLPASCFIDPEDRPSGALISLSILARREYRGLKLGKILPKVEHQESANLIKILTKQEISCTFLLGDVSNLVEIEKHVSGTFNFSLWRNTEVHVGCKTTANHLQIEARRSVISIGKNCMISEAWIQASDMHGVWSLETKQPLNKMGYSITIEDGVWVGRQSSIVRPVKVGRGSIIAFGAVVTKDVPPCSIVAGNPAKVTKRNVTWTRNSKDLNEFNERFDSMQLGAELIDLTLKASKANWLRQLSHSAQKLKSTLFNRANPYG